MIWGKIGEKLCGKTTAGPATSAASRAAHSTRRSTVGCALSALRERGQQQKAGVGEPAEGKEKRSVINAIDQLIPLPGKALDYFWPCLLDTVEYLEWLQQEGYHIGDEDEEKPWLKVRSLKALAEMIFDRIMKIKGDPRDPDYLTWEI